MASTPQFTSPRALEPDVAWVDSKVLFGRLGELSLKCEGLNANDLAVVLISACITEGVNTLPRIIGVLRRFGFEPSRVAAIVDRRSGRTAASGDWCRDENGVYRLHEEC